MRIHGGLVSRGSSPLQFIQVDQYLPNLQRDLLSPFDLVQTHKYSKRHILYLCPISQRIAALNPSVAVPSFLLCDITLTAPAASRPNSNPTYRVHSAGPHHTCIFCDRPLTTFIATWLPTPPTRSPVQTCWVTCTAILATKVN